MVDIK